MGVDLSHADKNFSAQQKITNFPEPISGHSYQDVTVTFDGKVLAQMKAKDLATAHVIQMAAFWNFNASYQHDLDGNPLPKFVKMYFDTVLIMLWDIKPRFKASTSESVKYKTIDPEIQTFMDNVKNTTVQESDSDSDSESDTD